MSYYSKSSPSSSRRTHRYDLPPSASSYQSPQPSTPYMGTVGLPPLSPAWSDSSFGSPSMPVSNMSSGSPPSIMSAPHMHPVDLPPPSAGPSRYIHGLATPPGSPQAATTNVSVHPLLRTSGSGRALTAYNVTYPPSHSTIQVAHGQGFTPQDLAQTATSPPLSHIRLSCQVSTPTHNISFPWTIDIESHTHALTVSDVLARIHASLMRPVAEGEYARFPPPHQEMARFACTRRQRHEVAPGAPSARGPPGLTRADFLGESMYFMGIHRSADGSLVLRLSSAPRM